MTIASIFPSFLIIIFNAKMITSVTKPNDQIGSDPQQNRSLTILLVALSLIFLATSLPSTIFLLASKTMADVTDWFTFNLIYGITGQLVYVNSAVNFYVYSVTGKRFREEFLSLICCKTCKNSHRNIPN